MATPSPHDRPPRTEPRNLKPIRVPQGVARSRRNAHSERRDVDGPAASQAYGDATLVSTAVRSDGTQKERIARQPTSPLVDGSLRSDVVVEIELPRVRA